MQSGLVTVDQYRQLDKLDLYSQLGAASDRFHVRNNPFHQWSRRWEYPWVVEHLRGDRILDAGAGFTFFPFYLATKNPKAEVFCVDYEESLARRYAEISAPRVHFRAGSLQALPLEDETFDSLYCISVLEHTGDYDLIAREFHRVLRPGGQALITFDICLNGMADIAPVEAARLLEVLKKYFTGDFPSLDLSGQYIHTEWIRKNQPEAMPWKFPRLSALKAAAKMRRFPKYIDLTFCTLALTKRKS